MKILFMTSKTPLPMNEGHALRTFNLLKAAAHKHDVTLLSCVKFPVEYQHKEDLEKLCVSVRLFDVPENRSTYRTAISAAINLAEQRPYISRKYNLPALRENVRSLLTHQKFDLVHLDMLPLGVFLDEIGIPTLLNEHNVESALLKRRAEGTTNPVIKWYLKGQQKRLELFESQVASRVSHVITCSEEDKLLLSRMAPNQNISVVPNGVDIDWYTSTGVIQEESSQLVFVGGMNWFPNRDAVVWFDEMIYPLLQQKVPEARLDVVGKSDPVVPLHNGTHIVMRGFVDDTRPYLEKASIVIVPIRVGGGTRLKVLEAMSMGKAIVSTTAGVEGIRVEHERHLLIADTPADFVDCIIKLINNPQRRKKLGATARELACSRYHWDSIGQSLLVAYDVTVSS
jgi:sugar transferase (PEP-CTERM/EpsH1 system associated)